MEVDKKIKEEYISKFFDREVRSLISQLQDTIKSKYSGRDFGEEIEEEFCLNQYFSLYEKMLPDEHFDYFQDFYDDYREDILSVLEDDRWLKLGDKCIQIGDGGKQFKNRKIMLSKIFSMACKLQELSEKSLEGLDEKMAQNLVNEDINRPTIILLHLLRIFYILNESDKEKLGALVSTLENELGAIKTVGNEPWLKQKESNDNPNNNLGGFSGLFSLATSMMEKIGLKPPEGIKPPSENELSAALNKVFCSDTTKNTIENIFTSLQNCQDVGSAIKTVVDNVSDPATLQALQSSVEQFQRPPPSAN